MTPFPPLCWLGAFASSVLVSVDSFLLLLRLPLAFAAQLALERGMGSLSEISEDGQVLVEVVG
jgi:hypothetical protein